jgi:hypothetical protein
MTAFQSSSVCGLYSWTPDASVTVATAFQTPAAAGIIIEFMMSFTYDFGDIVEGPLFSLAGGFIGGAPGSAQGATGGAANAGDAGGVVWAAVTMSPTNSVKIMRKSQWNVRIV